MIRRFLAATAGLVMLAAGERAPGRSFTATLAAFRRWFVSRPLFSFIALTRAFGIAAAPVGAFAALRFTRELGLSGAQFGALCSAIALASLLALLASSWIVERLGASRTLALAWIGCSAAALTLGVSDSPAASIAAYALYMPLHAMCSVPLSLWSARIAETAPDRAGHNAVFTVQKLYQAGVTMAAMALLGLLEPLIGMATLIWCGGVLGFPLAALVLRLGVAQRT